jgi:signal transduction histidine kinase
VVRIVEDFQQVGTPGRARDHGVGLGLGSVRRAAAAFGHPVSLVSRAGRGSRFTVEVPLTRS